MSSQTSRRELLRKYVLRRLFFLAASVFISVTALFALLRLLPGDPSNALISVGMDPEQIQLIRDSLGIDQNLVIQYFKWINNVVHLDFGTSYVSQMPVGKELGSRLAITIPLTFSAFALALLIAIPTGFISAYKKDSWYGNLINSASQLGIAIPVFWVGLILIYIFALQWGVLPAGGFPYEGWGATSKVFQSAILPVTTIALVMSASLTRYIRSASLDVLESDFIRTSRSLGFSRSEAMIKHGIRNAAAPVISILGIELSTTFIGAVVVEQIFALPGLGSMLVTGISEHDYPVIQAVLLISTLAVLIIGFLADLIQRILDPRLLSTGIGGR